MIIQKLFIYSGLMRSRYNNTQCIPFGTKVLGKQYVRLAERLVSMFMFPLVTLQENITIPTPSPYNVIKRLNRMLNI